MNQIGLPFDWAGQARLGHFIVSGANRSAAHHIEGWRGWPVPISVLSGPPRSGKSLLAHHFAQISGGKVIEDAEHQSNTPLFHEWNMARDSGQPLLLVSRHAPLQWTVTLPDLRSRLAAVPHMHIDEPDDELVRALIEMGLHSGGSAYSTDLPEWLARRIERSYSAVAAVLDELNRLSLATSRKISIATAKEALQNAGSFPILTSESDTADGDGKHSKEPE